LAAKIRINNITGQDIMRMTRYAPLVAVTMVMGMFSPVAASAPQQDTRPVEFGDAKKYTHPSEWFTIQAPEDWEVTDNTKEEGEVIVSFSDATGNAAIIVDVFKTETPIKGKAVGDVIGTFAKNRFSKLQKVSLGKAKALEGGGLYGLEFTYNQPLDKKLIPMRGEIFGRSESDEYVTVVTYIIPDEQYDDAKDKAYEIIGSLEVNTEPTMNALGESDKPAAKGEVFGDLKTYTHAKRIFKIDVPENWEKDDKSKAGTASTVIFSNPDGYSFVMIEVAQRASKTAYKATEMPKILDKYLRDTVGKNVDGFKASASKSVGTNTASQAFSFTIEDKSDTIPMVGIMYLFQSGSNVSYLRLIMPADSVEANSDALDAIVESFSVSTTAKP
jgi:hypothetical protein